MPIHYVSPTGTAAWASAQSIDTPCALATANANATAGDVVCLRGGTYRAPLIPSRSGTSGAKIIWRNYADEVPTISSTVYDGYYYYNILLWGRSWHVFDGINVLGAYGGESINATRSNVMLLEVWYNSNYNEFRNMDIDGAGGGHMTIRSSPDATRPSVHNWIHHCSIHDIGAMYWGGTSVNQTIGPQIETECNNTTIEDCEFYHLGHSGLETFGYQSVYKNNFFHNEGWMTNGAGHEVTLYLPDTVPPAASANLWGHRNLALYSYTGYHTRTNMLVEGNRIGTVGPPAENSGGENLAIAAPGNIIRFNDLFNAVNNGVLFKQGATRPDSLWGDYNAFYNNTIYKAGRYDNHLLTGLWQGYGIWGPDSAAAGYYRVGNHLINNIVDTSGGACDISLNLTNNTVESNFTGGEPLFVNTTVTDPYSLTQPDLSLQAGSPCLRAGRYLTLSNWAGTNSTTLGVDKAMFFQDGTWGSDLARGVTLFPDWIAIGTVTNVVEIEAVNYETNVITLASPMTWADDAPIWLYRDSDGKRVLYGSAPDIGAHETESGENPMAIEKIVPFTLEVLAPADIFCEIIPATQAIRKGRLAVYQINLQSLNDIAMSVALEVLSLVGATAVFGANPVALAGNAAGATTLTIDTTGMAVAAPVALQLKVTATEV